MLPHRKLLATILAASLLASGCLPKIAEDLNDLQLLRNELTKKFGDQTELYLPTGVNRGTLYVSFINSAYNNFPHEVRSRRAAEAAQFVKTTFRQMDQVSTILVSFLRRKTQLIVFHHTQTVDSIPFAKDANLMQPPTTTPSTTTSGVALETVANYMSEDDESNVFAYGIQLEGDPGADGVTVLPNYKTKGDLNVKKGRPPKTVQFDFASYSSTPRFEETESITFVTGGKPVFATKGTFHGNDTQFCYLPVPYPAFRKMIAARSLTIRVGAKEYSLTPRQFGVVQKMGEYITE
ncbi:MAG TPA: hypothetical protein VJP89_14260 [Pyrinomonadaceae bacterium]|nr:hypothetical protein [Pyrinomonadaceae bacterium]